MKERKWYISYYFTDIHGSGLGKAEFTVDSKEKLTSAQIEKISSDIKQEEGYNSVIILNTFELSAEEGTSTQKNSNEISQIEKYILGCALDRGYNYIARDYISVCVYENKPSKGKRGWGYNQGRYKDLSLFNDIFKFISSEDEEPTKIDDILNSHVIVNEKEW